MSGKSLLPRPVNVSFLPLLTILLFVPISCVVQAQTLSVIYAFPVDLSHGIYPASLPIFDQDGVLYGTTSAGTGEECQDECGTIFKLSADGKETVLHSFMLPSSGESPDGFLFRDEAGNLYGTTSILGITPGSCLDQFGSSDGCGTVFKLDTSNSLTVLHRFTGGENGWRPFGISGDRFGNVYGVTTYGGVGCTNNVPAGCGVIFRIDASGKFSVLHRFSGGGDGAYPQGPLLIDSNGNLYGVTSGGGHDDPTHTECFVNDQGSLGCGTIFKLDTTGHKTTLYEFSGLNGSYPAAGLVRDAQGNFYGTAKTGGANILQDYCPLGCGVVFKLAPSGHETVLYNFTGIPDGGLPSGQLVRDAAGVIYGFNFGTGGCDQYGDPCGAVYRLEPSGHLAVLHDFERDENGGYPGVGLAMDSQGNLYGTAQNGGDFDNNSALCFWGCGLVFKISPPDNLKLTSVAYPTPPAEGGLLTYAFKVQNTGTFGAAHEVLTTQVPEGETFSSVEVSGTAGESSCTTPAIGQSGPVVCIEKSVMRPGSTWTIRLTTRVTAPAGTVLSESGAVSSGNAGSGSATIHNTVH